MSAIGRPVVAEAAVEAEVVRRSSLEPGESVAGPAVIEEDGSTTFVEPGMTVERSGQDALVIETGVGR